jgi:hypothetical protein
MLLPCPYGCGAGVERAAAPVADGDGVWAVSGATAVVVSADAHGDPPARAGAR